MSSNQNESNLYQAGLERLRELRQVVFDDDRESLLLRCSALQSVCEEVLVDWMEAEASCIYDLDTALAYGPGIGAVPTAMGVLGASQRKIHIAGSSEADDLVVPAAELLIAVAEVMFEGGRNITLDSLLGLAQNVEDRVAYYDTLQRKSRIESTPRS